jgi:uncharacterized membrane protein YdcZ (DUF606 family)
MTQVLYVAAALAIGTGSAVQIGLVSALGRERGATEAAWINVLGTFGGMALVFLIGSVRSDPPNLPAPFNGPATFVAAAIVACLALVVCMKGLDPYLAIAGLFGFLYLYGAGYLGPRVGVALFAGAVTAGTLVGSVGLDHVGAFGGEVYRVNAMRVVGLVALLAGVVLVRASGD